VRSKRIDETLLVRYLLGDLPEEEQVRVEDRAFSDAEYLAALEGVEADLIDAWVRGDLAPSQRPAFESQFLTSPARRRKVEFARALARVAAELEPSSVAAKVRLAGWQAFIVSIAGWNRGSRLAAALAGVCCVSAAVWLAVEYAGMRSRIEQVEAQRRDLQSREEALGRELSAERRHAANLAAQLHSPAPAPGSGIASLILLPGLSRAQTRVEQLVMGPNAQLAHFEIQLGPRDDYPRFRAELQTRRGQDVLTFSTVVRRRTAAGYAVSFDAAASALASGDYELELKGIGRDGSPQDVGFYYFKVLKR